MRKTLSTALISAAAFTMGCHSHHGAAGPVSTLPADTFKAQWTSDLHIKPKELLLNGDNLFLYSSTNNLYRLNAKSGSLVFVTDVAPEGAHVRPPVVTKDAIVIPADSKLYLVDQKGYRKTAIDLDQPIRSGMVGNDSGLYVGVDSDRQSGRIGSIDLDRPASPFRWQLHTGGVVISTPAIYKNVIYAGSDDGKIYAVTPDRDAAWGIQTFQTGGPIRAGIVADDSGVYAASLDGKLYVLDKDNGKLLWQFYSGTELHVTPAVTPDMVYLAIPHQGIVAINKKTGDYNRKALWSVPDATEFLAENSTVALLRGRNNHILAVDKKTGEVKFENERKDLVVFAQNTSLDGIVYCATDKGLIIAAVPMTKAGQVGQIVFVNPDQASLLASR